MASGEPDESGACEPGLRRAADVARTLAEGDDLDETLQRIVDLAVSYIGTCAGASVMFLRDGDVTTPASTGAEAQQADLAQHETGEGPCLAALREHTTVIVDDIGGDDRWRAWHDEIEHLGWRSMVGKRLFLDGHTMGALNLYSREVEGFDEHAQALGEVFASHASIALKTAISVAGLREALQTRDVIGQAKGVLMERRRITGQQAFDHLRELSNNRNVKLRELARQIVETGEIPD